MPVLQSYSDNAFVHIWIECKVVLKLELYILFSSKLYRPGTWEAVEMHAGWKFDVNTARSMQ